MRLALVISLALALVSLLWVDQATYDPTAWLIWGRQISEGTLETVAGPSWKPLPVVFTTVFAFFGDDAAMSLWVVVARVGGLMSFYLAYRVTSRLAGRAAAVVAVIALALAAEYEFNWLRGNSEGLLVAFGLLAADRHFDRRYAQAFAAACAAALLRPDVWLLLAIYGLWIVHDRRDLRTTALVIGSGVAVALAWFIPEYIGSGDFFRAANRARESVPGSPGASDHPFLATFGHSAQALSYGVYAGAVLSLFVARHDRRVLAIAAASGTEMVIVALMATGGFSGNLRYVALPMALLCVLAGVGWAWLARQVPPVVLVVAALVAVPGVALSADRAVTNLTRTKQTDRFYGSLPDFIKRAGGREAVLRCGPVVTGPYNTQALAYRLHKREQEIGLRPQAPGSVLDSAASLRGAGNRAFALKVRSTEWMLRQTC